MSDRIIFSVKHDGKLLAYLYQNWGMGDGPTIAKEIRKAAKKYRLDLTTQAGAVSAVRLAGEAIYGHAKWNGARSMGGDDKKWLAATKADRDYLKAHRDEIIADNQDESGIVFFYGVSGDYVEYIDEWCEDAYTMTV